MTQLHAPTVLFVNTALVIRDVVSNDNSWDRMLGLLSCRTIPRVLRWGTGKDGVQRVPRQRLDIKHEHRSSHCGYHFTDRLSCS